MIHGHSIVTPSEVSAEWLTTALQARDIDARVTRFDIEQVGTGQLGETRRFHLQYDGPRSRKRTNNAGRQISIRQRGCSHHR